jgi:hypothetical protein
MPIKFSKADAKVLQEVARIDKLGSDGAKVLLLAPVADFVLAMDSPVEFAAAIAQSDFPSILQGALNIQKIAACTAFQVVSLHLIDGDPPPIGDALAYFQKLNDSLDSRCQG